MRCVAKSFRGETKNLLFKVILLKEFENKVTRYRWRAGVGYRFALGAELSVGDADVEAVPAAVGRRLSTPNVQRAGADGRCRHSRPESAGRKRLHSLMQYVFFIVLLFAFYA